MTIESANYSPLVVSLKTSFELYAQSEDTAYLLVYWQGYGETTEMRPVQSGQYPWSIHDAYMAKDNNASILAFAFDLRKDFNDQFPSHMTQMNELSAFAFQPQIHIPDRTGHVPAEKREEAIKAILRPKPSLTVIRND